MGWFQGNLWFIYLVFYLYLINKATNYVSNIEEHFLMVTFGPSISTENITVIKKKNNLLLSLKVSQTGHKKDKSKLNFLVVFFWIYKRYMQRKIPWIEANYKHCFRIEIALFTIAFFEWLQRNMQTSRILYGTCWDTMSELEINWFYCPKLMQNRFWKKGKLYGHLFSSYKEKIWLQFKYTCFLK